MVSSGAMRLLNSVWWQSLALWVGAGLQLSAATAFDSLAFPPAPGNGPQVTLPEHPDLNWSRVEFKPALTNNFPEQLKPLRVLSLPAGQLTGLVLDAGQFWVACAEQRKIYCLRVDSGEVASSFAITAERPAGLCQDGQTLWLADAQGRTLCRLDRSGQKLKEFAVPFVPAALWRSRDVLLVVDWDQGLLHRLDPETGHLMGSEPAPDDHLSGLADAGDYFWFARAGELIRFDRDRGLPVCGFNAAIGDGGRCAVTGLAIHGGTLWMLNQASNQLVQIAMPASGAWIGGQGRVREAGFEMTYRNTSGQAAASLVVLQHIPFLEMPGQRYLALRIQPEPRALFRDDLGNVVAMLDFGGLPAGQSVRCEIATTMWVADRRLVVDPRRLGGAFSPAQQAYALPFHPIAGEQSAEVKAFIGRAVGGETNAYWRVRLAHDALCRAIYYREPVDESVPGVLRQGYGVCRNYSAAMESFGRLLGVPVLNAWAPRHETCMLMLPGLGPSIMEVTANDSGPDPATSWRRSRWFLGTSAGEITTGVRGYAMHSPLRLEGALWQYHWHYWLPAAVPGIRHEGWWTQTDPGTGKKRRL